MAAANTSNKRSRAWRWPIAASARRKRKAAACSRVVVVADADAATRWRAALASWAIPQEILDQASESPWIHPPVLFQIPDVIEDSPSHQRAREVLSPGASVLDVGCGGGVAAFALTPPATSVVGVDHQGEMLTMFRDNANARGLHCATYEGFWPEVAAQVEVADVAVAHHVVYNVADLVPFLQALHDHARSRVVLELPDHHPLSNLSSAWEHFWGLTRPTTPTPDDLMDVLVEMGLAPRRERWRGAMRQESDLAQAARFTRVRLCLAPEREGEVYDFLAAQTPARERELSTVFWDVG
ncbi:MAG: class I SAM-dependent methyltransferase [Acidobacteriota bacterium]|nr:class I SAM-dependent methyltransferase [Acidobacteriota bacterium]